ncbi:MAG TPA: hypothetical protein VIV11_10185 [Kofleriaceae bacterium]
MKLPVVLASLFAATTAYAQSPGDYEEGTGAPGYAPVEVAPVVVTPPPRPRRWSVGLGVGSLSLSPHGAPEIESQYSVGQLAVRFLATRHLEIELAFAGGREQLEDGYEGDREVSQGVLALRYRFSPGRRWNWWLMAGMGSLAVTHTEASEEEREYAQQSTLQFGLGLERRWSRFALQLELRAVGVKAHEAEDMPVSGTLTDAGGNMTTPDAPERPPGTTTSLSDGMSGGQMVISGNYYF